LGKRRRERERERGRGRGTGECRESKPWKETGHQGGRPL
jgi:hypothetical protein